MPTPQSNFVNGTLKAVNIADIVDTQAIIAKTVSQDYKNELAAGDNPTISIKIPGRGKVVEGKVAPSDFQQQTNTIISHHLTKKTIPIEISELDASTTIEAWTKEVMQPIKENFSTDINRMVLKAILTGVDGHILKETADGKANFNDLSTLTAMLVKSKVTGKKWAALDPSIMAQVRTSGVNLFTGGTVANDLYNSFDIASYGGVEYIGTPDMDSVTYPSAFPTGTLSTTVPVANNSKTITLSANITVEIPEGVLFTIANVFKVDAEGKELKGQLKTFITEKSPAGQNVINLKSPIVFSPDTVDSKARTQVKNVSALPATGAAISWKGTVNQTYLRGVLYAQNIAAIANRPLTDKGKQGSVTTTSLAGMASLQLWERTGDMANGDIWQSISRLDAAFPLLGLGGVAYYVAAT